MDQNTYDRGLEVRKAALGEACVNNAGEPAGVDSFRIAREVFAEMEKA